MSTKLKLKPLNTQNDKMLSEIKFEYGIPKSDKKKIPIMYST